LAPNNWTIFIFFVTVLAKYCNEWTRVAVVRVRHGAHRLVASCLPLLQQVEQHTVTVTTLYTGATLRQCYKFIQVISPAQFCVSRFTTQILS
jgi:RNase P/RNase MRP subunit POP5